MLPFNHFFPHKRNILRLREKKEVKGKKEREENTPKNEQETDGWVVQYHVVLDHPAWLLSSQLQRLVSWGLQSLEEMGRRSQGTIALPKKKKANNNKITLKSSSTWELTSPAGCE